MTKIKLYFDCDGVILDTIYTAEQYAKKLGYNPSDPDDFHQFFVSEANWFDLIFKGGILNNSLEKIRRIAQERPEYDVAVLTKYNPENKTEESAKRAFFSMFLPDIEVIMVPFQGNKHETVNPVGNILIDDSRSNVNGWREAGGIAIHFHLEYESDFDNDSVNDIDDFTKTNGVKRLLMTR